MKKILATCLALMFCLCLVAGCKDSKPAANNADPTPPKQAEKTSLTAAEVLEGLKTAGLPIGESVEYTAETDTNNLLGRPGQYTGKVNFEDTRIDSDTEELDDSIEVFSNKEDLQKRADYIKDVTDQMPAFLQYQYMHKNVLLRLDKALTPDQAAEYEKALKTL